MNCFAPNFRSSRVCFKGCICGVGQHPAQMINHTCDLTRLYSACACALQHQDNRLIYGAGLPSVAERHIGPADGAARSGRVQRRRRGAAGAAGRPTGAVDDGLAPRACTAAHGTFPWRADCLQQLRRRCWHACRFVLSPVLVRPIYICTYFTGCFS